jgi:hypothetical protein
VVETCSREDAAQLGFAGLGQAGCALAGSALGVARAWAWFRGDVHLGHAGRSCLLAACARDWRSVNLRADGLEIRSTCLVLTTMPASSWRSRRPASKGSLPPTRAIRRRTPGENEVETMSHSESLGITPRAHEAQW